LTETSIAELVDDLGAIGMADRISIVHTSWRLMRPVQAGISGVLTALIVAKDKGELLLPTFNFHAFPEHRCYDRLETPGQMGAINEVARRDVRFIRTIHPMLSFAVHGYGWVLRPSNSAENAHGPGSVFDDLVKENGLLISIGADQQTGFKESDVGFTSSVHAFHEAGVDWRATKAFTGTYVDTGLSGKHGEGEPIQTRTYTASVTRDPSKHQTAVTPGHLEGERQGVIRRAKLGRTVAWVANARDFNEFTVKSCIKNPELWRKVIA
jgi:aminoglycoside N3'-acetyltransferase